MENFKALSTASYRLKRRYPECKRNIKYDDERLDMILDFKTTSDTAWKRLRPSQARTVLKDEGLSEEVSASDLSELLGGGTADEDEDDDTVTED